MSNIVMIVLCITVAANVIVGLLLALAVWLESRRSPGELGWVLSYPPGVTIDGLRS